MAFSVWDKRRGTWSVRFFNGIRHESVAITNTPPRGFKPGDPKPKEPPAVLEVKAEKIRLERAIKAGGRVASSLRAFLDARRDLCLAQGSANSACAFKVFDHFADYCGDLDVDQVTPTVCQGWFAARSREISRKTKKRRSYNGLVRDRALLKGAWSRAVKLGQLPANPWAHVEVPTKPEAPRRESWSPEQLEQILTASNPWLRNLLIVGCNTGLRINALLKLEWRDIKFGGAGLGEVRVRKDLDKAGKGYVVPMSRRCFETLSAMPRSTKTVLVGMKGGPLAHSGTAAKAITRACVRAGLPEPSSPNHHMRRSFGRMAVLGQLTGRAIPIFVVSRWLGHASVAQTEYYLDMKDDESHRWMEDHAPLGHLPVSTNTSQ